MTEAIETNRQDIQGSQGALTVALFCNKF